MHSSSLAAQAPVDTTHRSFSCEAACQVQEVISIAPHPRGIVRLTWRNECSHGVGALVRHCGKQAVRTQTGTIESYTSASCVFCTAAQFSFSDGPSDKSPLSFRHKPDSGTTSVLYPGNRNPTFLVETSLTRSQSGKTTLYDKLVDERIDAIPSSPVPVQSRCHTNLHRCSKHPYRTPLFQESGGSRRVHAHDHSVEVGHGKGERKGKVQECVTREGDLLAVQKTRTSPDRLGVPMLRHPLCRHMEPRFPCIAPRHIAV